MCSSDLYCLSTVCPCSGRMPQRHPSCWTCPGSIQTLPAHPMKRITLVPTSAALRRALLPMLACLAAHASGETRVTGAAELRDCLALAYEGAAFIEVAPLEAIERSAEISPEVLNNTNRMRLHVFANGARDQALLVAIYDNLGKGASGAAVQNLNLMIGADERLGADLKIAA